MVDALIRKYILKLKIPVPTGTGLGKAGNLSVHQCPICYALIVEDYMTQHFTWHNAHSNTLIEDE